MNTTIKYIGLFFLAIISLHACKTDDMNYVDTQVTAVKTLYEPAENKAVKLLNSEKASLYFEWQTVKVEDGGAASYEVLFDKVGGDFSNPIYTVVSDKNGFSNGATIAHKVMNKIAAAAGIESATSGDVIWTVAASRGINTVLAEETRTLNITTLEGIDAPSELFITGEATETGTDLAAALSFNSTGPGEFEIYTKLEAGKTYHFVDGINGTPRMFYSEDGSRLKESTEEAEITASKTGIYRINLDFSVATISYTEITSIGLWFCPSNKVIWNLEYQGKGVWTGTGVVNFKQESWGKDQRYKFQIETVSGGKAETKQIGTVNTTDSAPTDGSDPSYYYVRVLPNVTQWDDKWKFMDKVDGKSTTISLLMQGAEYTHTVTVN